MFAESGLGYNEPYMKLSFRSFVHFQQWHEWHRELLISVSYVIARKKINVLCILVSWVNHGWNLPAVNIRD